MHKAIDIIWVQIKNKGNIYGITEKLPTIRLDVMIKLLHIIMILSFCQTILFGQSFVYKTFFDIEKDGIKEEVLLYNLSEENFEDNQFTKISFVKNEDTISFGNDDVWVEKKTFINQLTIKLRIFVAYFMKEKRYSCG